MKEEKVRYQDSIANLPSLVLPAEVGVLVSCESVKIWTRPFANNCRSYPKKYVVKAMARAYVYIGATRMDR